MEEESAAMPLTGKQILLGVSGSIAAYKAADLCSQLSKLGAEIHVVLTAHCGLVCRRGDLSRPDPQSGAQRCIR